MVPKVSVRQSGFSEFANKLHKANDLPAQVQVYGPNQGGTSQKYSTAFTQVSLQSKSRFLCLATFWLKSHLLAYCLASECKCLLGGLGLVLTGATSSATMVRFTVRVLSSPLGTSPGPPSTDECKP